MDEKKKKSTRLREFKHCEVCEEDVPREKFGNHQFWLFGIRMPLCRGMSKSKRRFYEEMSQRRINRAKAKARSLGLTTPEKMESYLRGLGLGVDF